MSTATMSDYYTRMIFFDADQGLLLGKEMFLTTDGGKSWQPINTVTWDGQFSFVDRLRGGAVARGEEATALVYTINGDEEWQMLRPALGP